MVSKNNFQQHQQAVADRVPHYGIRKLSVGVASVLLGTTFYMGINGNVVHADTVNGRESETPDSQVANSNTNSESKSGTGANAALGNSQVVVSAAEDVVKNEVNTKPQVTEIKNDSHVQSDAANAKLDASTPVNTAANTNTNTQSGAVNTNANVNTQANTNTNEQSQNDQNRANVTQSMRVMRVASRVGDVSPNALNASLAESNDYTVMQQAIQQTSTLRDDRSTDYAGYIKGQAQSVNLKDGSSLSVNSDVINSDTDKSAILTFKSASFKPGDTYTILIPHIMMRNESNVAHLQPSFGTTTVDELHLNDGKYYWKIVDRFVNSGTVSQAIKLSRITGLVIDDLNNYFSSADFWRPYDLIHGTINLIKGADHGALDFKYQLGSFRENLYPQYNLANGDLKYPLVNGQAYDFNVGLSTVSLIKNDSYDGFGLGKDVLKDVRLSIENDHDYLKLNNSVANIYNENHQLIGTMSVKADHSKLIFSDLKLNDTVPVIGSLVRSSNGYTNLFRITFNATVNVPKQLFNGQTFGFSSDVDDFSFTFNNPKVGVVKPGNPVAWIKVLPDLNSLSTGNLISYSQSHSYMDLGASDYTDGNKQIVNRTVDHDDISGVRRYSGFNVNSMNLSVNGVTLSNLNYHLDIPDGFDLYSLKFDDFDHITSVIIRLKDGTSYKISSDDLFSHRSSVSDIVSVGLNRSEGSDLQLDSNSSIASVDIKYHDVDSSVNLEPVLLNYAGQNYRIAPTYASGKPVQVGDLLKFTATLSSTDPHVKIDSAPIVLDDVLITDPNNDTLRVYHDITSEQSNKTPGVVNAGNLFYTDSNYFDRGFPHLKHAVAYLQVPDNASLTDIKKIAVESGINREYGDLTPKSISLVKVANGVTFIKVDLSNYNDIRAGFQISVPYSNIGDLQTSSRPSSMLVVSDNFDQNFEGVEHFLSDADSRTDASVKALIDQEHIDVNKTDYQGSTGTDAAWWDILTSDGITSATMTKGNVNSGPSMDSKQDDHAVQADRFDLYGSTISATDQLLPGAVQIINVPGTSDGYSQFNPQLTGPIHLIDANTGKNLDNIAHVTYSQSPAILRNDSLTSVANEIRLTAGQVTDWSNIKSIAIHMDVPKRTSVRAVLSMTDPQLYDHVGKTIYIANAIFSTQADSPVSEYHLKPIVINAGDLASAKLTVAGQSTVKTMVHYHDAQGDHYVELPDKARTYNELHDTMNRSDFPQSDSDLTAADRALLPAGMVLDYAHPKIKNSNETYLNNYQNGTAAFGQQVKYDFDQDQVIFEGAMPTQTSDTKTVTETIHYVYSNGPKAGQKAVDDVTKSVEFNRTGFKNPFTGDIQWMKATDSKTFDAVKSPEIKGYQVDQSEIGSQTVTQDSNNIEKTVKYFSQSQKMTINYIDDDAAGKVLHTDAKTGLSNETADYTTANEISTLAGQHYVLVSDDTKGQQPVYDADVDADQVFNVHFKHATHSISDSRTVTETVHYQAADGSQVPNDHLVKANFNRTGTHDEVTGADHWNAWNISSYDFDAVPTPAKTGYTPDVHTVPAETVTPASNNIRKVVTYTPDSQKLSVKFVDDTTGQVLKTVTKTGATNAAAGYNTQSDIQSYEGQHYVLVSDSSNGANLVFDNDDNTDQTYEVHLKHGTHQIDEHHTIMQTVHYTATDHASVPDDHTVSVQFDRDGYHDEVTGDDHWNSWKQGVTQTFTEVPTPKKAGYTPDKLSVPATVVHPSDHNQTIDVTYTPDTQKVIVTFIDDTDNGKMLKTVTKTGPTNSNAGYTTGDDINTYKGQHYVLVSDQTHGQNITFDTNTNADQRYDVHLKHGTHQINDHRTITETVHYKIADGTTAPADHTAKVDFSRDGFNDEVTGADHWNAWSPAATHQFDAVHSPAVKGYTPDTDQIPVVTVNPDSKNIDRTVTYTPDAQKLDVMFIDDTTGTTLKTVVKNGVTHADAKYNTKSDIQNFESQHYVLVSDSSKGAALVFDNDDAVDQHYVVHLKHNTHAISEHHTVNETVHYKMSDGAKAPADYRAQALSFSRDGFNDEVTGVDHWNAWTPSATQKFAEVPTPAKTGYTSDLQAVSAKTVGPTDGSINVTVTYTPDTQNLDVKFIDDSDNGKVLKTVAKSGATNADAGYSTGSDIQNFESQHYVLVSDSSKGQALKFDDQTGTDQHYEVRLKHNTHAINEHHTVSETIHYTAADGSTVPADHTATVQFDRDGFNDEVTGTDHWNAWQQGDTQTFAEVPTPIKKGYTPDVQSVDAVTVNPTDQDVKRTVTYTPDAQKLDVAFIDDTTGKTLKTVAKNGVTNADAKYSTQSDIDSYKSQHYVLVGDSSNGAELVFDDDDAADQHYAVHLKHATHVINERHTVNETVHYKMSDGTKAPADYQAQALSFSRDGFNDEVTGIDHWNAWTPNAEQTFDKVVSPVVAGYAPDIDQINAQTVKPTDTDLEFAVTYAPNVQIAHVKYIDDTDHKVLTQDDLNGRTGETSGYHTADRITEFKGQHYDLVSDNYPADGITFDNNDRADQNYEVHFKHATRTDEQDVQVPRTIKYVYQNGQQAQPDHSDALKFHETKVVDLVDGHTVFDDWTPAQDFKTIETPAIQGYTPDHAEVANAGIAHDHSTIAETVTYNPDAQKAAVKYIDDTTGEQLEAKDLTGVSDQSTGYSTKDTIDGYINQHYVLVRDDTDGKTVVFDHDDQQNQSYEVHLKHGTEPANESRTKKITVHYQYADGSARSGKAADDQTVASLTFKRTGIHDLVTDKTAWNAWDHSAQTFAEIDSPAIDGYTSDQAKISNVSVTADSPEMTEKTVVYHADAQKLNVDFIDDTTGKTLKTIAKVGHSDESAGYSTKSDLQSYLAEHYNLVSDQTNGESLVFDHDDNTNQHYEVHLSHHTHPINEQHTVTETIHYQYADGLARSGKAADDYHADALKFSRTGSHDNVTNSDHWNAWTPADQQTFDRVQSPAIQGYTPDQAQIDAVTMTPDSQSIEKTVTYTADAQKLTVNFIDDTTGKTLKTISKDGHSDEAVGYNTKSDLQSYLAQHYDLVSDDTKGQDLVFDHDDSQNQVYNVHLSHHTHKIDEQHTVAETIHYVYADGLARSGKAADDFTADALKFSRDGFNDEVTGVDHWNAWTPADHQMFAAVQSPAIGGYTPDQAQIDAVTIDPDSQSIEKTVTYTADAQKLSVNFIDDTTGKTLKTVTKTGHSDEAVGYSTKSDLQSYLAKHYDLVSDDTQGQDLVFDHDDSQNQVYNVHLIHHTHPINEQHTMTETVHYVYADGLARTGKAADDFTADALKFSRDGFNDEVTGTDHWNAWTPADHQTFAAVQSPAIEGYTPDQSEIGIVNVMPTSQSIEKTVTYSADQQKLTVNFIDDTTGETLKTVAKTGHSDEAAGYSTKSDLQSYLAKHYDLVSDATKGADLVFDHDDGADQVYDVHLSHHLTPISDHQVVHETIHYVYADGLARTGKAADDYVAAPLEFNRTGKHDDVTGTDAWDTWIPGSTSFVSVQSPVIQGYTPDQAQIDVIPVNADSQDIVKTVTYSADQQTVTIDFIDDTDNGKVLKTVTKTGGSDEAVGYNTKADIQIFADGHYKLDHDTSNGTNLVFDHDDAVDQHYEVHLTHATKPISEAKSINETIRYQLADGTKAFDDYTAKVNFSRTGFNDLVTNIDHWNDWTPAVEQNFNAVQSPVKQGYTPDHAQIDAITVHPGDADTARTVIYSPDAQTVTIDYLDDVTGKTLQTKTITGVSDVDTGYTTAETINNYEGQHYKLVSDNTNGDQLVFDHDDTTDQHYEVHLTHTYKSVNDSATVNEAIHYQYVDGTQAKPDHKAEALNFSRTGTQDLVDNSIAWNAWTPDQQTFVGVDTPAIGGYTPDIETIAPVTVSHNTPDVERTVIYHADDQTILVHYIDDDTQSTLKTDSIIGKTSQKSGYKTGKTLDGYKQAGYDLVSDDTNGDELVFDNDSTKAQVYNVHLKHRHQAASDSDTVKQTVHYVYNDGSKAADDYTATPIEFTRTGDTDLVTGKTTWNAWTSTSQTFKAVPSPVIAGYTPGRATIDHIDVHAGDPDIDETVTYVPDAQRIVVNYIDSVTHQTLKTDTLDGRSDQSTNYNTQKNIDGYKNQHYTLVSDDTQGQNLVFDHDDQATQVYNVVLGHETETVHRAHTVSETIDYKYADGTEAAPTKTAEPKTFSQSGVHDLVTNTTDWNGQWTAPQTFNAVDSPQITGFTPDHASIDAVTVDHDSQDVHKLVVYTANKQAAKINYIDDVTGKTLETDTAAGHFGEQISFGRDVNDQIKQFENQGYKLVSNNFNGQKYQADDSNNVFEVHLTHQHQAVSEPDTVTETVKYQYADGTQAAKDSTQSAEFTRTGDKDLVTGTIVWMPSTETHQFDAVDSPAIDGFTPDVQSVPAATVKFGDRDITKVATYTANDQNAGIKIIDDTTGDVLNTQTATGKFGQTIEFKTDPDTQVTDLHGQGYELVSDNFSHQKYQSDNTKNQFEIHVRHQTVLATRTSTVTETVHYRDRNGNRLVPDTHETKTFTETGATDKVTGKTTWNATGTQTFNTVKVPTVTGYTPDRNSVPAVTVNFGDNDIDQTIVYTPDQEPASIKYVDDTTGKTLLTDHTTGDFGTQINFDHDPIAQISQYESQGYKLVSNSYGNSAHRFSATASENNFEVHLIHGTKDAVRTSTVNRVINYVDSATGEKLRPSTTQTLTFTEHGTTDEVTGETTWTDSPVQHFAKIAVPDIDGYTHQMQTVDSQTADFDSDDFEVTVPYTKVQTPNVPDTGTPTGGQSTPGTVTPTGGEDIPTGTQTINGQRQVISTADEPQHQPAQNNSQAQTLPQTGNSEQNGTALAGLGLIGMVGSLFGFKKKRD